MKDSIVVNMEYAEYDIIDGSPNAERHHVFGGANRDLSDEDGLWIPLSSKHHRGKLSVHMNKEIGALMHIIGQLAWERKWYKDKIKSLIDKDDPAREAFRRRYGRSYL